MCGGITASKYFSNNFENSNIIVDRLVNTWYWCQSALIITSKHFAMNSILDCSWNRSDMLLTKIFFPFFQVNGNSISSGCSVNLNSFLYLLTPIALSLFD